MEKQMNNLSLQIPDAIATVFYNVHMIKNVIFFGRVQSLDACLSSVQSWNADLFENYLGI